MSALTILRDDAIALCIALGFKTAGSWNKQRMSKKMADLAEMVEDGAIEVEDDVDDAERLNKLLLQIGESKGDVNVVQELPPEEAKDEVGPEEPEDGPEEPEDKDFKEPEDGPEEPEDEEKPVAKKAEKPVKKQPKAKKPASKSVIRTSKLDCFGNLVGSQAAAINAAINDTSTKNGITMEQICEATGLNMPRVKSHVSALVKDGKVTRTSDVVKVAG